MENGGVEQQRHRRRRSLSSCHEEERLACKIRKTPPHRSSVFVHKMVSHPKKNPLGGMVQPEGDGCTSSSSNGTKKRMNPSYGPTEEEANGAVSEHPKGNRCKRSERGVDTVEEEGITFGEDGDDRSSNLYTRLERFLGGESDTMDGLGWLQLLSCIIDGEEPEMGMPSDQEESSLWHWCTQNLF